MLREPERGLALHVQCGHSQGIIRGLGQVAEVRVRLFQVIRCAASQLGHAEESPGFLIPRVVDQVGIGFAKGYALQAFVESRQSLVEMVHGVGRVRGREPQVVPAFADVIVSQFGFRGRAFHPGPDGIDGGLVFSAVEKLEPAGAEKGLLRRRRGAEKALRDNREDLLDAHEGTSLSMKSASYFG